MVEGGCASLEKSTTSGCFCACYFWLLLNVLVMVADVCHGRGRLCLSYPALPGGATPEMCLGEAAGCTLTSVSAQLFSGLRPAFFRPAPSVFYAGNM